MSQQAAVKASVGGTGIAERCKSGSGLEPPLLRLVPNEEAKEGSGATCADIELLKGTGLLLMNDAKGVLLGAGGGLHAGQEQHAGKFHQSDASSISKKMSLHVTISPRKTHDTLGYHISFDRCLYANFKRSCR